MGHGVVTGAEITTSSTLASLSGFVYVLLFGFLPQTILPGEGGIGPQEGRGHCLYRRQVHVVLPRVSPEDVPGHVQKEHPVHLTPHW